MRNEKTKYLMENFEFVEELTQKPHFFSLYEEQGAGGSSTIDIQSREFIVLQEILNDKSFIDLMAQDDGWSRRGVLSDLVKDYMRIIKPNGKTVKSGSVILCPRYSAAFVISDTKLESDREYHKMKRDAVSLEFHKRRILQWEESEQWLEDNPI